jgi:hypothetical protein
LQIGDADCRFGARRLILIEQRQIGRAIYIDEARWLVVEGDTATTLLFVP